MNGPWSRRAPVVIGVFLSLLIAVGAYNLGVAQGMAQHASASPAGLIGRRAPVRDPATA